MRGLFIVLEGIDGAGTTTQAGRLSRALQDAGQPVYRTFEPSDGPVGALVRQVLTGRVVGAAGAKLDAQALALMFAADRVDHIEGEIRPRLEAGTHVLSDRYVHSSMVYQGAECNPGWVRTINQAAFALMPDLTFLLDLEVEVAAARRSHAQRREERFDALSFQRVIRERYRGLGALDPNLRIIDAAQGEDVVTQELLRAVLARL